MITLKKGCKGVEVLKLQKLLNKAGYGLVEDGDFGTITEEVVKAWQKANGLVSDGIVGPRTWQALEKIVEKPYVYHESQNLKKSRRKIDTIVVHSSATEEGKDYDVEWLRKDHKKKGYSDIGYHYVVYRDGTVHEGRDVNLTGAHARNHNAHSIGVVYIGGCELRERDSNGKLKNPEEKLKAKDTRTDAQKAALLTLLRRLKALYPLAKIVGHRNLNATACPSFDAKNEYKDI